MMTVVYFNKIDSVTFVYKNWKINNKEKFDIIPNYYNNFLFKASLLFLTYKIFTSKCNMLI